MWALWVPTESPKAGVGPTCDPYTLRVTRFLWPVLSLRHSAVFARGTACESACAPSLPVLLLQRRPSPERGFHAAALSAQGKAAILISLQALPRPQQEGFPDGKGVNSGDNKCLGGLPRIWSPTKEKMNDKDINLQLKKTVPSAPRILSMPCK